MKAGRSLPHVPVRKGGLLLAIVVLVGAAWSYILLVAPPQRTLDQRAYEVGAQIKCPVCEHESVADSSASIAEQMRLVIRQQLQAGESEQQVLQYFASHYGDSILLAPPQQGFHLLAWLVPIAMLLLGIGLVGFVTYDWRARSRQQCSGENDQAHEDEDLLADPELAQYRAQLEQELAEEDPLFGTHGMEID